MEEKKNLKVEDKALVVIPEKNENVQKCRTNDNKQRVYKI